MTQDSVVPTRTRCGGFSFVFILGLWLSGSPAFAFGPMGHAVVGEIAMPLVCESALAQVALVAGERDLSTAGLWADSIRDLPEWRHTLQWHYADVGDDVPLHERHLPPGGDLLTAISQFYDLLRRRDGNAAEQREALLFLIHLVGDLHQPLHVGRPGDYGGNSIPLIYGKTKTNLHSLWDGEILVRSHITATEYAWALAPLGAGQPQHGAVLDVLAWAEESRALRHYVYAVAGSRRVSRRYEIMARSLLHRRLVQAGVRLAGLLNGLYCPR